MLRTRKALYSHLNALLRRVTFIVPLNSLLRVQASIDTASTGTAKSPALRGYRSVDDVALECGSEVFADIGWAIFEASDGDQNEARGIINTYNDYATYVLVHLARAGGLCRLHGVFTDGKAGEYQCTLDDVVIENMLVQDTTAVAGFRAKGLQLSMRQNN